MCFFIVLVCLSLERFFSIEAALRRAAGFHHYITQIRRFTPLSWQKRPYGILFFLLPTLSLILGLHILNEYYLSKPLAFLVEAIVLLYCLGPTDIYHQSTVPQDLFEKAHTHLFAVLFWFALLGPVGVLLFRLLERLSEMPKKQMELSEAITADVPELARRLLGYFNWLPIRFFVGIQSILGKFPETLRYWLDYLLMDWTHNNQFLENSGRIALDMPVESTLASDQYTHALALFDKMLLIFLGMLLAYTLLSWII
jgi:AmpE protein